MSLQDIHLYTSLLMESEMESSTSDSPKQVSFNASHYTFLRWGTVCRQGQNAYLQYMTMTRYQHFQKREALSRFDQQIALVSLSMGSLAFYPALNSKQKNVDERIFCKLLKKIKNKNFS